MQTPPSGAFARRAWWAFASASGERGTTKSDRAEPLPACGVKVAFPLSVAEPLTAVYRSLLFFLVVYCARPQDWIPALGVLHLAKVTFVLALVAFFLSLEQVRGDLFALPREVFYLILLFGQLCVSAALSPVWRGGAVQKALDFSKVVLIAFVVSTAVTSMVRLRRLMYVQTVSVAAIVAATLLKGHMSGGRLEGVLNGSYQSPNELAVAIAVTIPFAAAFLLRGRGGLRKLAWAAIVLVMIRAVLLTASRSGLLAMLAAIGVCLWEFGVKGRRGYLITAAGILMLVAPFLGSRLLRERVAGTFSSGDNVVYSYGSARERRQLLWRSLQVTAHHPLFGVGVGNFQVVSGVWKVTHNAYTQMSAEGGIPALILFLLVLRRGSVNLRRTKWLGRSQPDELLFAGAFRASLWAFMVGALFDSVAYLFFVYILVAFTTAMLHIAQFAENSVGPLPHAHAGKTFEYPENARMLAWRW